MFVKKVLVSVICISLCLLTVSCKKKREETITFDDRYPLALAPDVTWAVIVDPYAAYKTDLDWNADIAGHCRKGDVLQVLGNATDSNNVKWYRFLEGWLPENCLSVYSNRYKAQTAADSLKDK